MAENLVYLFKLSLKVHENIVIFNFACVLVEAELT